MDTLEKGWENRLIATWCLDQVKLLNARIARCRRVYTGSLAIPVNQYANLLEKHKFEFVELSARLNTQSDQFM